MPRAGSFSTWVTCGFRLQAIEALGMMPSIISSAGLVGDSLRIQESKRGPIRPIASS